MEFLAFWRFPAKRASSVHVHLFLNAHLVLVSHGLSGYHPEKPETLTKPNKQKRKARQNVAKVFAESCLGTHYAKDDQRRCEKNEGVSKC